jgi:hypothetical protein
MHMASSVSREVNPGRSGRSPKGAKHKASGEKLRRQEQFESRGKGGQANGRARRLLVSPVCETTTGEVC